MWDFLDKHGELDFSTFLTIMHTQIKQEDPKKEILLAMLMADKEKKGYIMASELRSKLTKLGEKLTHKEGNSAQTLNQLGRARELWAGQCCVAHGHLMNGPEANEQNSSWLSAVLGFKAEPEERGRSGLG